MLFLGAYLILLSFALIYYMGYLNDLGFSTRMFDPAGQDDIGGGCGQLWFVQDWMKNNPDKAKKSVGFGMESVHAPTLK